jgi:curli biogenesis system outer membrane secretion channel CsgG
MCFSNQSSSNVRVEHTVFLLLCFMVLASLAAPGAANAQTKRIAILPFDDSVARTQQMNIGEKVADGLISKIAGNGTFEVVDRQYLDRIMAEQNLKMDARFDATNAAKLGKLANVDLLIMGRIDAFNAEAANAKSNGLFANKTTVTGQIELKATARLISVENASIIAAPSSNSELSQLISQTTEIMPSNQGSVTSKSTGTQNINAALMKLVDSSVEAVSVDLAKKIEDSAAKIASSGGRGAGSLAKVVGMDGSLTLINRGSSAGMKPGLVFSVVRVVDTGLKDPDTGKPVTKKKKVCNLAISDVDDSTSSGKCDGEQPQAGDEVRQNQN